MQRSKRLSSAGQWLVIAILACYVVLAFSPANAAEQQTVKSANKQEVIVYTYHSKPPYVADIINEEGSYYDFVATMNDLSDTYHFTLHFLPRNRLDLYLRENKVEGFVIGVNPKWFKDIKRTRYFWSEAIYNDRDEFVSLASNPFEFTGADSLHGKVVGASRGYIYRGVDTVVAKGLAQRINAVNEAAVFKLILKGRVDVGIISKKSLPAFFKNNNTDLVFSEIGEQGIHLSKRPHDEFTRHLLIPKSQPQLFNHLEEIVPLAKERH